MDSRSLPFLIATPNLLSFLAILKLALRLRLSKCFSERIEKDALLLAESALICARHWLDAEHASNSCLDVASSGGSVLEFPASFVSLLSLKSLADEVDSTPTDLPPLTEVQLQPTLESFVQAVSGDEALLRPLGCALSSQILHSTHWRTRLSAIRLLHSCFDRLTFGDQSCSDAAQQTGIATCLVSDTLTALSEALEDDHPEVESAANRLFAQLEQSGLSGNSKRTWVYFLLPFHQCLCCTVCVYLAQMSLWLLCICASVESHDQSPLFPCFLMQLITLSPSIASYSRESCFLVHIKCKYISLWQFLSYILLNEVVSADLSQSRVVLIIWSFVLVISPQGT